MAVMALSTTVTSQLLLKPPSWVVAVTVAEPVFMPVRTPAASTETIPSGETSQRTLGLVALAGSTEAVRVQVLLTSTVAEAGVSEIPVTSTTSLSTVTVQDAVLSGSDTLLAVITAVPTPEPTTLPAETIATSMLLDSQVTDLSEALSGSTDAVRV